MKLLTQMLMNIKLSTNRLVLLELFLIFMAGFICFLFFLYLY